MNRTRPKSKQLFLDLMEPFFDTDSADSLAEMMLRCLDERSDLPRPSVQIMESARARYSVEAMCDGIVSALQTVK